MINPHNTKRRTSLNTRNLFNHIVIYCVERQKVSNNDSHKYLSMNSATCFSSPTIYDTNGKPPFRYSFLTIRSVIPNPVFVSRENLCHAFHISSFISSFISTPSHSEVEQVFFIIKSECAMSSTIKNAAIAGCVPIAVFSSHINAAPF